LYVGPALDTIDVCDGTGAPKSGGEWLSVYMFKKRVKGTEIDINKKKINK